jgi:diguanylate cyclase (GGDEF)-like protein
MLRSRFTTRARLVTVVVGVGVVVLVALVVPFLVTNLLLVGLQASQPGAAAEVDRILAVRAALFAAGLGVVAASGLTAALLLRRWFTAPLRRLASVAARVEAGEDVTFAAPDSREAATLADALEAMRARLRAVQAETARQAAEAVIVNRFLDSVSFAEDDERVGRALIGALQALASPDGVVMHLGTAVGRTEPAHGAAMDGATPRHRRVGDGGTMAVASHAAIQCCVGVRRGGSHLSEDPSDPLDTPCPAAPPARGAVACVPLTALGMNVGMVHLRWDAPGRPTSWDPGRLGRVVDHAALAIANRRLLVELRGMASTDARTGLANSRTFDEALDRALAPGPGDTLLAVVLFDLDHFKAFNDAHGHAAGDEALRAFATIVRASLREGDVAARYGGEEFVVLLRDVDAAGATAVAERIRRQTEATSLPTGNGARASIGVSAGVAAAPEHGTTREGLLRAADGALYTAKRAGRNRVERAWSSVDDDDRRGAAGAGHGPRRATPAGELRPVPMDVGTTPQRPAARLVTDRSGSAPRS